MLSKIKGSSDLPVAAYNVSGEYSMIYATHMQGWASLKEMVHESLISTIRAGADILITYWADNIMKFSMVNYELKTMV